MRSAPRTIDLLLVDDNEGDALLLGTLLESAPYPLKVRRLSDGEAAIDVLCKQTAQVPDAVILDVNMPRKNGLEVLAEIRKCPHLKNLPVFILTGSNSPEEITQGYALNASSFLTKPDHLVEIEAMVANFLNEELPLALRANEGRT